MSIGLGLDVGGTKILGIALTDTGEHVAEVRVDSPHQREFLLDVLEGAVEALLDVLGPDAVKAVSVGIGFPGLVEVEAGALHAVPNLPAAQGFTLRDDLQPRLLKLMASRGAPPLAPHPRQRRHLRGGGGAALRGGPLEPRGRDRDDRDGYRRGDHQRRQAPAG